MRRTAMLTIATITALAPRGHGQGVDSLQSRLDLAARYFQQLGNVPGAFVQSRWLPGERLVFRPEHGPDRNAFVVYSARDGARRTIVSREELAARAGAELPVFLQWTLSPDSTRILFRAQGRGFALSIADGSVAPADTADVAVRSVMPGAVPSPAGAMVVTPRGDGFAIIDAAGRVVLERTGEDRYSWQVGAGAWSPDGRYLLAWRNDARNVHTIPVVDYRSALERVEMVPYTKTGTPLAGSELYLIEPASGRVDRVRLDSGETYDYPAGWRPDGSEALIMRLSRTGKRLDLLAVRAADAAVRPILREERAETFVGALDFGVTTWQWQLTPLPDNRRFLWMSERDGWRHVYAYDYTGRLERQVTRGPFPVQRVVGVASGGSAVYVMASRDSTAPYDLALYRAGLDGREFRRLTPEPGVHDVSLSPGGQFFSDRQSTRAQPPVLRVRPLAGGREAEISRTDISQLTAAGWSPPESLTVTLDDGTRLYGVLYQPTNFDPGRRYATIDYIYGGPWLNVVPWDFSGSYLSRNAAALAQMGFVVMVLDARGTPGRSKAFQDHNYGRIGQTEIAEHVTALRHAAASRPWIDTTRFGIYGHSWGGYYALRGMLAAPDVFKAGYAGAPGALEEEALINEPNMNTPEANPEGYRIGSNLALAGNLRGALRIMHGTSDVNASLSTTMRMSEALIRANRQFEQLIMPGQPHGPQGSAFRYYADDVRRFFWRTLGGPR